MEWTQEQLIQMRVVLAHMYPDKQDQRRVLTDVKIDWTNIPLQDKAINSWFEILRYAKHQHQGVERILDIAILENDGAEVLRLMREGRDVVADGQSTIHAWKGPTNKAQLERIIGVKSTLTDIVFLEIGLEKARSVARIQVSTKFGTGFLIRDNLLVTNNHVLKSEAEARQAEVQFNYQKRADGSTAAAAKFRLDPDAFFRNDPQNDWTIVQINGDANREWGQLELKPAIVSVGDRVNIIQHPGGLPKQIAYLANTVVYTDNRVVQYLTDTEPGSSGSPVFNMHWDLVALHHSWVKPDAQINYVRNEGIVIDLIIQALAN